MATIFTCVSSQHLILCDITAATATATAATPRFLKFDLGYASTATQS